MSSSTIISKSNDGDLDLDLEEMNLKSTDQEQDIEKEVDNFDEEDVEGEKGDGDLKYDDDFEPPLEESDGESHYKKKVASASVKVKANKNDQVVKLITTLGSSEMSKINKSSPRYPIDLRDFPPPPSIHPTPRDDYNLLADPDDDDDDEDDLKDIIRAQQQFRYKQHHHQQGQGDASSTRSGESERGESSSHFTRNINNMSRHISPPINEKRGYSRTPIGKYSSYRNSHPRDRARDQPSRSSLIPVSNNRLAGNGNIVSRNVNYNRRMTDGNNFQQQNISNTYSNQRSQQSQQQHSYILSHSQQPKYKPKGVIENSVNSAKRLEQKDLQSKVTQLKLTIEELTREKKTLEMLNKRQEKALKKYEGSEAELPRLIRQHKDETTQLKESLRKSQGQIREFSETLRHRDQRLIHLENEKKRLSELVLNDNMEERSTLQNQLKEAQALIKTHEDKVVQFQNRVSLLEKNYSHQMANENIRFQRVNKKLFDSKEEVDRLKILLRDKERTINYLSLSRITGRPEPPRITYQKNHAFFRSKHEESDLMKHSSGSGDNSVNEGPQFHHHINVIVDQIKCKQGELSSSPRGAGDARDKKSLEMTQQQTKSNCKDYYFKGSDSIDAANDSVTKAQVSTSACSNNTDADDTTDNSTCTNYNHQKEMKQIDLIEMELKPPQGFGNTDSQSQPSPKRFLKLSQISDDIEAYKSTTAGEKGEININGSGYFLTGLQTGFFAESDKYQRDNIMQADSAAKAAVNDFYQDEEGEDNDDDDEDENETSAPEDSKSESSEKEVDDDEKGPLSPSAYYGKWNIPQTENVIKSTSTNKATASLPSTGGGGVKIKSKPLNQPSKNLTNTNMGKVVSARGVVKNIGSNPNNGNAVTIKSSSGRKNATGSNNGNSNTITSGRKNATGSNNGNSNSNTITSGRKNPAAGFNNSNSYTLTSSGRKIAKK